MSLAADAHVCSPVGCVCVYVCAYLWPQTPASAAPWGVCVRVCLWLQRPASAALWGEYACMCVHIFGRRGPRPQPRGEGVCLGSLVVLPFGVPGRGLLVHATVSLCMSSEQRS